ncbi:YitT family protein [Clostridium sartagoforme]|uniref:YitT family protein n=1 Tax=Clostridium sartagoforme TaxID=84031 RepID=UPI0031E2DA97
MKDNKITKALITIVAVFLSSLLQAYVIQVFIQPSNLLSSGFTGVAILIDKITSLYGGNISVSLANVALNIPVAFICYKYISPRFTFFSLTQVFLTSLLLKLCNFPPIFDDLLLNVAFGGFAYGISVVFALKGNASTGGTDFIALFVSNKIGKSIWEHVFVFNTIILIIFGAMFGWLYAGYSILFQFISTKTISTFHHRYERVTLQITTQKDEEIIEEYIKEYRHGISCIDAVGGYSKKKMKLLHTVVSSYEVNEIVSLMKKIDPKIIINVLKTETFFGGFYRKPIE